MAIMKVSTLLVSFQLITMAISNSLGSTYYEDAWKSQCVKHKGKVTGNSVVLPPEQLQPLPIDQTLAFILLKSRTAMRICDELTNIVILEVNKTSDLTWTSESSSLETLIPGNLQSKGKEIKIIMKNGIQQILRAIAFLEVATNDTEEYSSKMMELEKKSVEILCEMYQVMIVLKARTRPTGPNSKMLQGQNDLQMFKKHKRNYFMAKALKLIFDNTVNSLKPLTENILNTPKKIKA